MPWGGVKAPEDVAGLPNQGPESAAGHTEKQYKFSMTRFSGRTSKNTIPPPLDVRHFRLLNCQRPRAGNFGTHVGVEPARCGALPGAPIRPDFGQVLPATFNLNGIMIIANVNSHL